MNLNDVLGNAFGNVYAFPSAHQQDFQRQLGLAVLQRDLRPVPTPEESQQYETDRKNKENYARWLARMMRDPLTDVVLHPLNQ